MATCLKASIHKRFNKFDLTTDFTLKDGITALVGPSGSGKTTLIRCLAGIEKPNKGQIRFGDENWFNSEKRINLAVQQRRVGFVFNDYALFPQMTVWENVCYGTQDPQKAKELLEILEISELQDRYPRHLSAGQQQRVAIGRAIAQNPRLLLMDEPFSSIDLYLKNQVYEKFLALQRQLHFPTVIVTHDLNEASQLASEIMVIDNGRILQSGTPKDILFHPRHPDVARMVGIRNLFHSQTLDGSLAWENCQLHFERKTKISGPQAWYIRADKIRLGIQAMDCENTLSANVAEMAIMGLGYRIIAHVEGGGSLEIFASAATVESLEITPGMAVLLGIPADAITFFPEMAVTTTDPVAT